MFLEPKRDYGKVQQPNCWNEYDDVASRFFITPVVVRAMCVVIYSRGAVAQFNATFHVTKVLKGDRRIFAENTRVDLNFGIAALSTEKNLLQNQSCTIPKVDLQKEYLLFLYQANAKFVSWDVEKKNEVTEEEDIDNNNMPGTIWSIYAAPEVFSQSALASIQKVQKRGTVH